MTWQNVKFLITKTNNKTDIPNSTISCILYASTCVNNDLLFLKAEDDQQNRDKLKAEKGEYEHSFVEPFSFNDVFTSICQIILKGMKLFSYWNKNLSSSNE